MQRIYKPGKVEVSFWKDGVGITVPPELLGTVTVNIEEGEVETNTQAHVWRQGNGKHNATATVMMFLPSLGYLGKILRSKYNAASAPEDPGNLVVAAGTCSGQDTGVFHIHPICEDNDKNDVHFYEAEARPNSEIEYSEDGNAIGVELIFNGHPDEDGNIFRLGTGDLTQDVVYDAETDTYTVVTTGVPSAPTALSANTGTASGTVALSWTAPVNDGGSSVTDYKVEHKRHGLTTWTTFADGTSTTPSATVTGLTAGSVYDFRVSAINANGTGVPSEEDTATAKT